MFFKYKSQIPHEYFSEFNLGKEKNVKNNLITPMFLLIVSFYIMVDWAKHKNNENNKRVTFSVTFPFHMYCPSLQLNSHSRSRLVYPILSLHKISTSKTWSHSLVCMRGQWYVWEWGHVWVCMCECECACAQACVLVCVAVSSHPGKWLIKMKLRSALTHGKRHEPQFV